MTTLRSYSNLTQRIITALFGAAVIGYAVGASLAMDITHIDTHGGVRNPIDLHSAFLPPMFMYAYQYAGTDWIGAAPALMDAIFSENVALAAGI